MRTIEHSRDSLEALLSHSGTRRVWPQFLAAGGTSATDLEYWLAGQELDAPDPHQKASAPGRQQRLAALPTYLQMVMTPTLRPDGTAFEYTSV